MLEYVEI